MADNNNIFNKISSLFNVKIGQEKDKATLQIKKPIIKNDSENKTKRKEPDKLKFDKMSTTLKKFWDYWLNECHDTNKTFSAIQDVYKDMDYCYWNSTIYSRAVELYANEVVQLDSQDKILEVYAPDSTIEKEIQNLFEHLDIVSKLRPTARSIVHKGNACWTVNPQKGKGIVDITQKKVEELKDRIEFSPMEMEANLMLSNAVTNLVSNNTRLKQLIDNIEHFEEVNYLFKKYLIGFQVNDFILAPWNVLHFRNKVYDSVFDPFGMPLMINCVAPFRMYDTALTMHTLLRGSKFPREHYELNLPDVHPTEMAEKMHEFINEMENVGIAENESTKQDFTTNTKIYTIRDRWEYDLVESRQNLDDIADVELHKDNLIIGTGVPRDQFDPEASAYGHSGIALTQQYKPFGRAVFSIQNSLLEELTLLVKIHLVFKDMDPNAEFELSMPYPQSQENPDMIRTKSDMLRFANDILGALKDNVIGDRDAKIPPDVAKSVYKMILPFSDEEIDTMIDDTFKYNQDSEGEEEKDKGNSTRSFRSSTSKNPNLYRKILQEKGIKEANKIVRTLINPESIRLQEYKQRRKIGWGRGLVRNRHYVHSYAVEHSFSVPDIKLDFEKMEKIEKLQEMKAKDLAKKIKKQNKQHFKVKIKEDDKENK